MFKKKPQHVVIILALMLIGTIMSSHADNHLVFTGSIDNDTPYIDFPLTITETQNIAIDMRPDAASDLDTLLYLVDDSGVIIAENDDRARDDLSSLIIFPHIAIGQYQIIATRYGGETGDTSGDFTLSVNAINNQATEFDYDVSAETLSTALFPEIDPRPVAEWTLLAYYGGDTNLEAGIINDLNEFEVAGGSTDSIRIVLLLDRNPEFTASNGNWSTARLFEVGPDLSNDHSLFPNTVPTIDTVELADLGEVDTGDGELLAQFLTWGITTYPAHHYAVAFASHGSGWQGLITDDTSGANILSVPELTHAFTTVEAATGIDGFDLLVNDACNMSSIEYHSAMASYFDYSFASPEVVSDPALDMTLLIESLSEQDELDIEALGAAMVDKYVYEDAGNQATAGYFNHALTNLTAFDPVEATVERFATLINDEPALYVSTLGRARTNTYSYAAFAGATPTLIDLGDFMRQVIAVATDTTLIQAAEDVIASLDGALVYGNAGQFVANRTTYYNIYFPDRSQDFDLEYFDDSQLIAWGQMLRNYYNTVTPRLWIDDSVNAFHAPRPPQVTVASAYPPFGAISVNTGNAIGLEIVGRNIARVEFIGDRIEDDGTVVRMGQITIRDELSLAGARPLELNQGVNRKTFFWDGTIYQLDDGITSEYVRAVGNEELVFVEGQYRETVNDDWNLVSVVFPFHGGDVQQVISRAHGSNALATIHIPDGAEFQVFREIVTPDGRTYSEDGTSFIWHENDLLLSRIPAPSGQYVGGFVVTTFGGVANSERRTIMVNNDDIDPNVRVFVNTYFGMSTPHPVDWIPFRDVSLGDEETQLGYFSQSSNPDGTQHIAGYPTYSDGSLDTVIAGFLNRFGYENISEPQPITFAHTPPPNIQGLEFTFQYETEMGTFIGRGVAVNRPNRYVGQVGMVLSVEALNGEGLDDLIAMFDEHMTFFHPGLLELISFGTWNMDEVSIGRYGFETFYPLRLEWVFGHRNGIWLFHTPLGVEDSPIFAAVARTQGASAQAAGETLLAEYVESAVDDIISTEHRSYHNGTYLWDVILYEALRAGELVTGRLYTTEVDRAIYAMWFEAPTDDTILRRYIDTFEPMIDGFSLEWREYEDPNGQFAVLYPNIWSSFQYSEDFQAYISAAPGETGLINIFPLPQHNNLEELVLQTLTARNLTLIESPSEIVVDERPALYFTYSYERNGFTWVADAFAFQTAEQAFIITVDIPEEVSYQETKQQLLQLLIDMLVIH